MINDVCCRPLRDAINDDSFPLKYDERIQEVQLLLANGDGMAVVRFCPFCGKKLDSGRSKLFTEPNEEECEAVRRRLHGLTSLNEIVAQLGEPNDRGTGCGAESDPWSQWATYSDIWNSLIVTIGEHEDARISWAICGQPIDANSRAS